MKLAKNNNCSILKLLYFCTNALHNAGYTIDQVANQAGHCSLNTTKSYLINENENLLNLANKL